MAVPQPSIVGQLISSPRRVSVTKDLENARDCDFAGPFGDKLSPYTC